ncbi:MAG: Short-chain reductase protein NovJ [Syntrophomonadaceae bacterium]|nr:Short-chain reductase protein NovJ [Bacillota bacterium]
MGLATAKVAGKEYYLIISGRTGGKLESALEELRSMGIEAEAFVCDVSERSSVDELAARAAEAGRVKCVIHAAGISPGMGSGESVMKVNALGTININEAFYQVMSEGSCIVNVSSMSAYMVPEIILPKRAYKLSRIDINQFMKKMLNRVNLFPKKLRSGIAYVISKHFVAWYTKTEAVRMGAKGIRIVSVSPGIFKTHMGILESAEGEKFIKTSAIKRFGNPEEIAELFAFIASDKCRYLTGEDIICDGGVIASRMKK